MTHSPNAVVSIDSAPFFRQLLDALPLTVWSVDLEGRITSANRSWSRFASDNGAPSIAHESSLLGCSIFDGFADGIAREQAERAMTMLRERRLSVVSWEFPCNSPTEERVFLMQVTALERDDEIEGFAFSTVDITRSHRSREALIDTGIALSEAIVLDRVYAEVATQLRRAIPSTGFVIALADDDTAAFHIVYRQGYHDSGNDTDALERRLRRSWLDALAKGQIVLEHSDAGLELTARLVSGEGGLGAITICAETIESAQALEEAERVLSVIAAQTAVAIERSWLVRRVEQKRRLEAIGEVASGVAHELRNPLFGISSAAQLLSFRARGDAVVERNVGRILREVERLNKMVGELLDFGKPNTVRLFEGDPELVWDDILEGERPRLESRGLTLQRYRTSARCLLDPAQMGQVFRNLIANACDASPESGELVLSSQITAAGAWRTRLANGGPAIPPDVLPHVFEFFYSTKAGGTGIGLALCQRIVDEHRGAISIDSAPEHGTTVTITLPGVATA